MSMGPAIDLRSDTVTKPSEGMRAAMAAAEVGDDQYGEDPTVRRLEERVAELFDMGAALFVPTGNMANQVALRLLLAPGQELLCDGDAHIIAHENGSLAAHAGVQTRTLSDPRGLIDPEALETMVRVGNRYTLGTTAVEVEQTHNRGGGSVYPLETLRAIRAVADRFGLGLHVDGARIWNAHAATGVALAGYGAIADTMSVCLSKGLGAPVGSVVLMAAERREDAWVLRKRLGGSMRQAGILAAAGLYALEHNLGRLAEDQANAGRLAARLAAAGVKVRTPETNILLVDVADAAAVAAGCAERGVLVSQFGPEVLRLVTHLDVTAEDCDAAADVLAAVAKV